jgi:hypothetical protein
VLNDNKFNQYKKLIESNVFESYEYENYVFAIQPPTIIHRNAIGRLHHAKEYAYQFKDGTGAYFINGRHIPDAVFNRAETLTRDEFIKEENSDYKGAWYEILGQQRVMELLGAGKVDERTIVHANGDLETVSLWKTSETFEEIGGVPFAWVKMVCPSTGTQYLQGVEPHHTNAVEAIASLSRLTVDEYSFNMRS